MKNIKKIFNTYSLSILAGILIGTSYIPLPPWANLFCFVPLWILWFKFAEQEKSYRKIFIAGWLTQFILTLIGFNWVMYTAHEFGYLPWPLSFLTLLLFCAGSNLDLPLAGLAWLYFHKKYKLHFRASLILLAIITAIFKAWMPSIFPWNYGYPWLWAKLPIAQTAELIGFQGLSSIIILLNTGFFLFWKKWTEYRKSPNEQLRHEALLTLAAPIAIFALLNLAGTALKLSLPATDNSINALIVQANIGNLQSKQAEKGLGFREYITERYVSLSREGFAAKGDKDIHFVVWPETAYPYDMDQRKWSNEISKSYPLATQKLIALAQELYSNLIVGGYGYSPLDGKLTNTIFTIETIGRVLPDPYYKSILLAFGEYIPGEKYLPENIRDLIPAGDFSRGLGPKIMNIENPPLKIGPQICYESLFPSFSKKLSDLGAEVIFNVTNDSWYGAWQEPYQHLYMTLARAIEFRRPLLRATNTGISTVILANGDILEKSPFDQEWTGLFEIPYKTSPKATFFQIYPWLMDALLIFLMLFIIGRAAIERNKKS